MSKVGGKYENSQQIKDDLNLIYSGKYKIEFVEIFKIERSNKEATFGSQKNILKKYSESDGNKDMHIYFTDYNKISSYDVRGKEIVTREAVNILYFLTQRKLDKKIKVVNIGYEKNYGFLSMVGKNSIIIPIDEYVEELQKLKKEGNSTEEVLYTSEMVQTIPRLIPDPATTESV
ncbi:hypothetical protein [Neobacillus sp. PS3-40]|uniref:hypothetical protein n=1 Tax=Neobacillus sp. PS3-40 TaxID=3070679 RepID=UPI0027E1EE94|nr:hypothetical protein [Neobacillus sp. PS3-40]WML44255.1 hypothetical protein RCG20_21200 [Neobacillus sp. PS3-40]